MKIVFRTAAFAAFFLTAAAIGLAAAATPAKADGWRHGNGWAHGHGRDHRRHWSRGHRRTVVVVRPLRLYAPRPRVIYERAPVIVRQAPVIVQQAPVVQTAAAYCREYTETVTIAGQVRTAFGTACLQPDGSWQKQD